MDYTFIWPIVEVIKGPHHTYGYLSLQWGI